MHCDSVCLHASRKRLSGLRKRLRVAPVCLLVLSGCATEGDDPSGTSAAALDATIGAAQSSDADTSGAADTSSATSDSGGVAPGDAGIDSGGDWVQAGKDSGVRDGGSPRDAGRDATAGGSDAGGGTSSDGGAGSAKFHVFLLLGQSNMAGYPKAVPADKVEDPRVRVLGYDDCAATGRRKDVWATAVPPLHECWNGAIGPGDYFAKTLIAALPAGDTIGLVPCAISGEKIETFLKAGGAKYSSIVSRAKLAQQAGGVIEGILFHQGESNCGDSQWPGKVKTLISDLRADLGLGDAPFLAGELAPNGNCANHNPLVNQLSSMIANGHVVSAQGLVVDPADTQWRLHFDHASQVTFGKRYAQTMMDALNL
jgi:hypothetical protein